MGNLDFADNNQDCEDLNDQNADNAPNLISFDRTTEK
jgi:hypothetical protein